MDWSKYYSRKNSCLTLKTQPDSWDGFTEFLDTMQAYEWIFLSNIHFDEELDVNGHDFILANGNTGTLRLRNCKYLTINQEFDLRNSNLPDTTIINNRLDGQPEITQLSDSLFSPNVNEIFFNGANLKNMDNRWGDLKKLAFTLSNIDSFAGLRNIKSLTHLQLDEMITIPKGFMELFFVKGLQYIESTTNDQEFNSIMNQINEILSSGKTGFIALYAFMNLTNMKYYDELRSIK